MNIEAIIKKLQQDKTCNIKIHREGSEKRLDIYKDSLFLFKATPFSTVVMFSLNCEENVSYEEMVKHFELQFQSEIKKVQNLIENEEFFLVEEEKDLDVEISMDIFRDQLIKSGALLVKNKKEKTFRKISKRCLTEANVLKKVAIEEVRAKKLIQSLNMKEYHSYFSLARKQKRKLKLYIGPTNSGKTYHSLNDLAKHETGVYLSPLRLLAWEGKEELEKRGKTVSLITGEERQIVENATFKAQTIETLNFFEPLDAVMIDEIQMIFDTSRGWAWTQALVGAPCKELIMAGAPESEAIVRQISELLEEELEVIYLERYNPLTVATVPYEYSNIKKIPEGSAIVAFSRKAVLNIKQYLADHDMKASVIYGNLSPEVRKEEARKFRDGETKFLVSTDAIAMGLNLPISEIIFYKTEKFNGQDTVKLLPMEIKQIGGRAGRYGKKDEGKVSAFDRESLKYIKDNINSTSPTNPFVYIKPSYEHISQIALELQTDNLFAILTFFKDKIMTNNESHIYVCADLRDQMYVALMLDSIEELTLTEKFMLSTAPIPDLDEIWKYKKWAKSYSQGQEVAVPKHNMKNVPSVESLALLDLELYVKDLNLYSWLFNKIPTYFPDGEKCAELKKEANTLIEQSLKKG